MAGMSHEDDPMAALYADVDQMQAEIKAWAHTNFGEKALGLSPVLGMIEEVGELAHAVLKKAQGIRGTPEEHDKNAVDAIGDVFVYMLNHLNNMGMLASSAMRLMPLPFHPVDDLVAHYVVSLNRSVCNLIALKTPQTAAAVLQDLESIAWAFGTSAVAVLRKTWDHVSKRDWVADPAAGGGHTHLA